MRADVAQRWVAGERIFDWAVRPVDRDDREIARADLKNYSLHSARPQGTLWISHSKKKRNDMGRKK